MKIGVIVDSFRLGFKEGLKKAAEIGADGIQVYTAGGDMSPSNLSPAKRQEIREMTASRGLVISALCGDIGGFGNPALNQKRVGETKKIMDLAKELGTDIVTTHIGVVPADPAHPRFRVLQEPLQQLGQYGDEIGIRLAIETGPEASYVLRNFIENLDTKSIKVNFDPANLVMVVGERPVQAVNNLKDHIVHTHAKDGIMLYYKNPEIVYGAIEEAIRSEASFREVPLGEGSVIFPEYIKALKTVGYNGFLTIERETGNDPVSDIKAAVTFLKGLL